MLKELEYPFDASAILQRKKKLRRELLAQKTARLPKRIAILGGYTTSDILSLIHI